MDAKEMKKRYKLKLLRHNLTQTELARAIGTGVNRVNDAISGRPEGRKYLPLIDRYLKSVAGGR